MYHIVIFTGFWIGFMSVMRVCSEISFVSLMNWHVGCSLVIHVHSIYNYKCVICDIHVWYNIIFIFVRIIILTCTSNYLCMYMFFIFSDVVYINNISFHGGKIIQTVHDVGVFLLFLYVWKHLVIIAYNVVFNVTICYLNYHMDYIFVSHTKEQPSRFRNNLHICIVLYIGVNINKH